MSTLPTNGRWRSAQNGDHYGDIVRSRNLDLNEDGYLALARKAMVLFGYDSVGSAANGVDPAFQGTLLAALTDSTCAYLLTTASMFVMDLSDNLISALETGASNEPSYGFDSDMVMFNGKPHVSGGQYVSDLSTGLGGTYTARRISGLATTVPHPLCVSQHQNALAVGNHNGTYPTVQLYDTSYANTFTITLPAEFIVTSIRWRQSNLYVGTRHKYGGDAKMFIWNGAGTAYQSGWGVGADWIYSMDDHDSAMHVLTSAGQIRRFNGGGFTDVANFPVYYTPYSWASTNANTSLVGRVTSRGMASGGSRLFINIDGTLNNDVGVAPGPYIPEQPSGLWVIDKNSGLYHKSGVNLKARQRLNPSEVDSSYLRFATAHQAVTGDPVLANPVTLTGLNTGQVYYAIVDDDASTTTMRLALSPADALEGRYVSIDGTPTTDSIMLDRYETFGATFVSYPGAVFPLGRAHPKHFYGSEVIFGAGIYNASNGIYEVSAMSLGMARNRGYFVTAKLGSQGIQDTLQKLLAFLEPLRLSTDQIVVKHRTSERFGLPTPLCYTGSATWASATSFTIDSTKKDVKSLLAGDEVEVVRGAGAGYLAHIESITISGNTYTITIDETLPVTNGELFDFVADNWEKRMLITSDDPDTVVDEFAEIAFDEDLVGKWAQFKVELRGRPRLYELQISSVPQLVTP